MTEKKVFLDVLDIRKRIPHRYPFLFIDRVDSYTPGPDGDKNRVGRKVVARKNVTANEPYFNGHFPHKPVMPGVLQVEAMAQAGALACLPYEGEHLDVLIAKIDNTRFRRPVVPGDVLEIHAEITKEKSGIVCVKGAIYCDKELVAETDITAKIFPTKEAWT
jgi:3-hydroxyacyl-[acyl-carrier-protein] dehydratase